MKRSYTIFLMLFLVALYSGMLFSSSVDALSGMRFVSCGSVRGYSKLHFIENPERLIDTSPYYSSQKKGNTGSCVKDIQNAMNAYVCNGTTQLSVDGSYGNYTQLAITKFQSLLRIRGFAANGSLVGVDGVVGPQTWGYLSTQSLGLSQRISCR